MKELEEILFARNVSIEAVEALRDQYVKDHKQHFATKKHLLKNLKDLHFHAVHTMCLSPENEVIQDLIKTIKYYETN